jgi:serine/threonine protein kinase
MNRTPTDQGPRTTLRPRTSPSTGPSRVTRSAAWGHTLPEGTRLGEFEIVGLVGEGGFGIVYLAFDTSLQRQVALKEYMPSSLASRMSGDHTVAVKAEHNVEAFRAGMASFINEARLLAQFDHPALVKVHRFWEANGTAYMVMPFYEGPTLERALGELGQPPDEAWLRQLLSPVLDALAVLHSANCLHRDIAPDNILLTPAGPLLLDFGAARRVIGDATRALTAMLKVGYAPIEQYGQIESLRQGPWTDIYALACVIYSAITGKPPAASIDRLIEDRMPPLRGLATGRYSESFLAAIDAGLAVQPNARPQDVAEFRALLDASHEPASITRQTVARQSRDPSLWSLSDTAGTRVATPARGTAGLTTTRAPRADNRFISATARYGVGAAIVALTGAAAWWVLSHRVPQKDNAPDPAVAAGSVAASAARQELLVSAPASPVHAAPAAAAQPAAPESRLPPPTSDRTVSLSTSEAPNGVALAGAPASASHRGIHTAQPIGSARRSTPRCNDLLQKASLEPLSPEDLDYWRRECT